jgi:phage host-nuclease inhibitor protein Gam
MAKSKLTKAKASTARVPQNRDEVVAAIAAIGENQRARQRIETQMNDEIAAIKSRYELQAEPLNLLIAQHQEGVQIWCEANRDALTQGGKVKTATFASGEVRWRITPPSVTVRKAEAVLTYLLKAGLKRFVRTKEEVNKDALLLEPKVAATIPGITINQSEEFIIAPFEAKLDEVA